MNGNLHTTWRPNTIVPINVDLSQHIATENVRTISVVDRYAATSRDESNDAVTRKGFAALRESNQNIVEPRNANSNPIATYGGRSLEDPLEW